LLEYPAWQETLLEALEVEEKGEQKAQETGYPYIGWEWHEVHTPAVTLNKMVSSRVLDISYSSRSSTHFKIQRPDLVRETLQEIETNLVHLEVVNPREMPKDLFDLIVGYVAVKKVIRYALEADRPCHCLLSGPPASAKTLFLMELTRLPDSSYLLAPTISSAGLVDHLFNYRPKFLLIDEVDRFNGNDLGILNSLMSTGRVSETKYHKTREIDLETKVFGAGIRIQKLPHDLMSRFIHLEFPPYNKGDFEEIAQSVLPQMEQVEAEMAGYIASQVWKVSAGMSDIRQVIQIARMAGEDMDRVDEIMETISLHRRG